MPWRLKNPAGVTHHSTRLGSARLGSARLGSARLGSARLGSAAHHCVILTSRTSESIECNSHNLPSRFERGSRTCVTGERLIGRLRVTRVCDSGCVPRRVVLAHRPRVSKIDEIGIRDGGPARVNMSISRGSAGRSASVSPLAGRFDGFKSFIGIFIDETGFACVTDP
ncbi:MAG: hypothetical protein J07HR59_01087 [Halorubrum sp. J07HR59]|nr:MAG: hypothetical protein J07HR59_01087 [Halorubrum sp. J07HR59]